MTAPSHTAIEQAEFLNELVQRLLAGQLWTLNQRKDARILVTRLIEQSRAAEMAKRMDAALERKDWDETDAVEANQADDEGRPT